MFSRAVLLLPLAGTARAGIFGHAPGERYCWGWTEEVAKTEQHFEQQQDHFDDENTNTWMQAFFVNNTFWAGPDSTAPVFLYIGGEGPESSSSVRHNFITDWLPATKGLLFSVEHRYYGCIRNASSCPYDDSTENHLQFLSSRQAIADLALFRQFAVQKYKIASTAKWVAVGGSYSGMLSSFVRAVYPELIHSSIASSAPVNGKLDMVEFENVKHDAYALNVEGVHGSASCRDAIIQGHKAVGKLLQDDAGRAQLATLFPSAVESAEWLADDTNQRSFAGCGVASFPAQSNHPTCSTPGCGISQVCSIMSNSTLGSPLQRLAKLRTAQDGSNMVSSCEMDWEMPGDIPTDPNEKSMNLFWGYQTCTEFGFYQTCEEGTNCLYTQGLVSFKNKDHHPNDFCKTLFNLTTLETAARIAKTNDYYQAKLAAATRIVWPNGDVDPWHGLSKLSPPGKEQPVIFPVSGAAHCAWNRAASDDDQLSIKQARAAIYDHISTWLNDEDAVSV